MTNNKNSYGKQLLNNIQKYRNVKNEIKEDIRSLSGNLYTLGVQAYIYAFPWLYLSQLRWLWTSEAGKKIQEAQSGQAISAPINSFWCAPELASSGTTTGGSPNTDTLYSIAWCDLSEEPLVLSVPAVTDRYYCIEISGIDSDTIGYVGSRATGSAAGNYLLVGPYWNGSVDRYNEGKDPSEQILDVLPRCYYNSILLLGRTGTTTGTKVDIDKALAIQSQYKLTPLSDWISGSSNSDSPKAMFPTGLNYNNTEGAWYTINQAMTECPPGVHPSIPQDQLVQLFATIGIGPNQDIKTQSAENLAVLQKAAEDGLQILKKATGNTGKMVNGWSYPPTYYGKAGQMGDYLTRASLQALAGITAHWTVEAVYLNTAVDSDGAYLSGSENYVIQFTEDSFPPFDSAYFGFWSITMYNNSYQLVADSEAYTVNSNNLQYQGRDSNGGMTILIQQDDPGELPEGTYWLQSPTASDNNDNDDGFYLVLRDYIPAPEVSSTQTWVPPSINKQN